MKILHVYGEEYSALNVEQEIGLDDAYQLAKANGGSVDIDNDNGCYMASVDVLTFGEVDSKFVDFIRNSIMDYDDSKHENFYEINEKGRVI